jgi:transposase
MEVRILRRQGLGLRAIAQETGMAVNTVRKYLADEQAPRYTPRGPLPGKLEAFKPYLIERIEAARPHWIPATVLAREIREQGFSGCEKLVSRFVRAFKPEPKANPVVRFETEPGRQMQVAGSSSSARACRHSWQRWAIYAPHSSNMYATSASRR